LQLTTLKGHISVRPSTSATTR